MPLFSRSKKVSQPSGPSLAEPYARSDSLPATNRPLPQLPSASDDSRDTASPPPFRSHVPYSPESFSGPPYHSHTATSPPPPERTSPNSVGFRNPSLDARTETEPRRSFKERLGFGSSRENLLDFPETNQRTTGLRRKLSSRRQPPPHVLAPVERSSNRGDILHGATFDNRPLGPGTSEKEELRDLSTFLRTTAPSRDQRRPFSIVGSPSAAQPQWAAGSPESEDPAVPRRARTNSLDDRVPRPDDRAYGIVLPPEDDVRDQDTPYESASPVTQSPSARNPIQGTSPASGKTNDALESHLAPAQRQPLASSSSSPQDQQLQVNELPERKASLQQPSPFLVQQDLQGEGVAAPSDHNPPQPNSKQELSAGSSMPASLRPPSRSTSQTQTPPSTPGRVGDMSQQMQQHHQQQLASAQTISGRRTPEPPSLEREISGVDVNQSAQYRELREKYTKVKRYYFEKEDQVKSLQNALAHQKLAASRTSLDDFEYVSRLTRLDGLISQLAYGFRKDWATVPHWLQPCLNRDAIRVGKQECTALGRAFISEWLAREVFETYFHPGLDLDVSRELKTIQRNIRLLSPPLHTPEEDEALTNKITTWRLATMDGLAQIINSPEAVARRSTLVELLNRQLVTALLEHLHDPPPPGIEGGAHMIVELAVSLLLHLPEESRDVSIEYYNPGSILNPDLMRIETGIPPLGTPMADLPSNSIGRSNSPLGVVGGPEAAERTSESSSGDDAADDVASENIDGGSAKDEANNHGNMHQSHLKKGLFGGLVGGSKANNRGSPPVVPISTSGGKHGANNSSQLSLPQAQGQSQSQNHSQSGSLSGVPLQPPPKDERVRLCVFLGAEIRGRGVLSQAPVYRF